MSSKVGVGAKSWQVHSALTAGALIYGASYVISKVLMPAFILPKTLIMFRVVGALSCMALYNIMRGVSFRIKYRDLWPLFYCAMFGVFINMELFFAGLSITSAVHSSLIMVCSPIVVLVLGYFYGSEKLNPHKVAGILLGTAGAVWLISQTGSSGDKESSLRGDIYVMLNAISFAAYLVLSKPLMSRYSPLTVNFYTFLMAAPFILALGIPGLESAHFAEMNTGHWVIFFFLIVATTFLTYTFNAFALNHVKSSVVGSYVYLQPLFAILISVGMGNAFGWPQALAGALICIGVFITSFNKMPRFTPLYPGQDNNGSNTGN